MGTNLTVLTTKVEAMTLVGKAMVEVTLGQNSIKPNHRMEVQTAMGLHNLKQELIWPTPLLRMPLIQLTTRPLNLLQPLLMYRRQYMDRSKLQQVVLAIKTTNNRPTQCSTTNNQLLCPLPHLHQLVPRPLLLPLLDSSMPILSLNLLYSYTYVTICTCMNLK